MGSTGMDGARLSSSPNKRSAAHVADSGSGDGDGDGDGAGAGAPIGAGVGRQAE